MENEKKERTRQEEEPRPPTDEEFKEYQPGKGRTHNKESKGIPQSNLGGNQLLQLITNQEGFEPENPIR